MSVWVLFISWFIGYSDREKKAIKEASKSRKEWIASDKIATDPVNKPTIIFKITIAELLITDKNAIFEEFTLKYLLMNMKL